MAAGLGGWPEKRRVTLIGALVNLLLSVAKIGIGWIGQSQALVADGVHSASDLVSDGLVLAAARWGAQDADDNHPYGHGRIETVATGLVGALLLLVAGGFVVDASARLLDPERLLSPAWFVLLAAALSLLAKECLFRYTLGVARRLNSPLLAANAWHHRSDALSSVVVLVGVSGALLGWPWLDAVAAIVVAGLVARMGWRFLVEALAELVDTGLSVARQRELEALIRGVAGVRGVNRLRSRSMAGQTFIDVEILLDRRLSLTDADQIATAVADRLLGEVSEVADVTVVPRPAPSAPS